MANISTTSLAGQYQIYFSRDLLKYAINTLRLNGFGMQAELPKNTGAKQISWFRFGSADDSQVQTLTEGTPISTFRDLALTQVNVSLTQYGEAIKLTDILSFTQLYDAMKQAAKTLGEDAALKADSISREAIAGAPGAIERWAQGLGSFTNLGNAQTTAAFLDSQDLLDAATNLKVNLTPMIDGSYVAVVPPQVARDLLRDPDFLEAAKYSNVSALYKGEIGSLYGVRIVIATNPHREVIGTQYTHNAAGTIFTTLIMGDQSFGVAKLSGDSPFSPKMYIVDQPDKSDPLNQTKVIAYKLFYNAKLLNGNFVVALRSKTRFA